MNILFKYFYTAFVSVILILSLSAAPAETKSSKNHKDQIEQKPLNQKKITTSQDSDNIPDTVVPVKKTIRNTITLKGFIEDPDAIPISIDTQSWADLRVSVPPKHGKEVKKGEIIMELDMDKIRTHLQFLSHDLNILDLNKEILQAEIKLAEELAPLEKAELDRFEKYVKEDYSRYKDIYLPFDKRSAAMSLKSSEQYLAYAAEELNQLKKMYEADDLTEETEEIILQRAQYEYERAKFSFEAAKIRNEETLQVQLPRGKTATDSNFNR